jgi:hypothetical protein
MNKFKIIEGGIFINITASVAGVQAETTAKRPCTRIEVINQSGQDILVNRCSDDGVEPVGSSRVLVKNDTSRLINGLSNSSQVKIFSTSGTPTVSLDIEY